MAGREGWGQRLGGLVGGVGGAILGIPGGPAGIATGFTTGAGAGSTVGAWGQGLANRNNPQYGQQGQQGQNGNFWTGNPAGFQQSSPYADWELPHFQQAAQYGSQQLQNPYQGFEPIEANARNQFQQNTIPTLAHRFSTMGESSLSSPVFNDVNQQVGKDFELGLAAQKAQYGMQNQQNALQMLQFGTPQLYNNQWQEGSPGFMSLFGPDAAGPAIGKLGANALGSYLGAEKGQGWNDAYSSILNGLKGV